ncbi:hypothetical protein LshimejAT787_1802020 [Lyophyllum shimeji]|uniref:Uncharacterized protein n=1 Tax=Lyophyllum shimeji TaxID=47721 RepID=A0A9P3PXJ0_LYOSH|nr:hypothetical protein LshimejAT787_1802020 [Lyophyllum shimeji]
MTTSLTEKREQEKKAREGAEMRHELAFCSLRNKCGADHGYWSLVKKEEALRMQAVTVSTRRSKLKSKNLLLRGKMQKGGSESSCVSDCPYLSCCCLSNSLSVLLAAAAHLASEDALTRLGAKIRKVAELEGCQRQTRVDLGGVQAWHLETKLRNEGQCVCSSATKREKVFLYNHPWIAQRPPSGTVAGPLSPISTSSRPSRGDNEERSMQRSQSQPLAKSAPRRFYGREWKRNKPHLPKSTSLPIFKLLPIDRPVFTCRQCGFLNTLVPLCLWCCWTSDAAHREFEESMPRARRVSGPPRVFWKSATSSLASPMASGSNSISAAALPRSALETKSNLLADGMPTLQHPPIRITRTHHRRPPNPESMPDHVTYRRDARGITSSGATAVETVNVTNATPLGPALQLRRPRWSDGSARKFKGGEAGITPRRRPSSHLPSLRHSRSTGVDRRTPMHLIRTVSTKSLRSTHIVIDFKALHDSYDFKLESGELSPKSAPTQRTLRRKRRVSLFRTSTPSPLPQSRPLSAFTSNSAIDAPSAFPTPDASVHKHVLSAPIHEPNRNTLTHARSGSQPTNTVRLGHPSRPYYTAIRPNMSLSRPSSPASASAPRSQSPTQPPPTSFSRPTRPMSLPTPARAPSPAIFSVLSSTSALSDEEASPLEHGLLASANRPRSSSTMEHVRPLAFGSLAPPRGGGFSLSGETELRMALAREQEADGRGEVFRFRDMGKKHGGARVMKKVRELKRGLKGLVTGTAG